MRLPAKIEYAIKAMVALARVYDGQSPLKIAEISESQGISSKFLLQLMVRLKDAKIVLSVRGASGGYLLARPARYISVKEIVAAVDSALLAEASDDVRDNESEEQGLIAFWSELNAQLEQVLSETTLDDMAKKMAHSESFVYTI